MSEVLIRAKIKAILESVDGVGQVYDYRRWANTDADFINLFKDSASGRILGWQITREKGPTKILSVAEEETTHGYLIQGFMSLKDSDQTEILFNALIELVRDNFRLNQTLDGLVEMAGPLRIDLIELRMFGGVLCHVVEMRLPALEILTA